MEECVSESKKIESGDSYQPTDVELCLEDSELSGPLTSFVPGGRVLLVDAKGHEAFIKLRVGGQSHMHVGYILHDELLGKPDGYLYTTNTGAQLVAMIPGLDDTILKMPRGAQVIYPKDIGAILIQADIFPGAKVLEAGVGSGAMSMALVRAGAHVTGYELRADFAEIAVKNVGMLARRGSYGSYKVVLRDIYEGIIETGYDRVILDLPEPWQVVPHLAGALVSGARVCAYQTSINQVAEFKHSLDRAGFSTVRTVELLERGWYISGRAVRPDHRMVAHTGFLTSARFVPALSRIARKTREAEDVG
jgi:tRNA (adenine57-N1/adenine58-N1)-methyltransferase